MKRKLYLVATILVLLLAALTRLLVLHVRSPMKFGGDEQEYVALAETLMTTGAFRSGDAIQRIFQGGNPGDPTAYRSPVLPVVLAAHYRFLGPSHFFPRLTLVGLSSLTCVLMALLGRAIGRPGAGLAAAALWALWPPAVFGPYAADRFCPETLGVFFLVAHSTVLVSLRPSGWQFTPAVVCGLCLGLAVLSRGYLALLVPITLSVLLASRRLAVSTTAIIAVMSVCVPAGWAARNALVLGTPVLSTQTDHFYLGNNRWARGSFNGDFYILGKESPQLQQMATWYPGFWEMSEVERSRAWSDAARRSVVDNPRRFLWLLVRKAILFLSPLQFWSAGWYRLHLAWIPVAALAGLCLCRAAARGRLVSLWPLLLPVAAVFAAVLATHPLDRYRFVIEPYVVMLACLGLDGALGPTGRARNGSAATNVCRSPKASGVGI